MTRKEAFDILGISESAGHAMVLGAYKMKLGDAKTETEKHVYNRAYLVITGTYTAEEEKPTPQRQETPRASAPRAPSSQSAGRELKAKGRDVARKASSSVGRARPKPKEEAPLPDSAFEALSVVQPSRTYERHKDRAFGILPIEVGPTGECWDISLAPDGRTFLVASASGVFKWDVTSAKMTKQFHGHATSDTYGCDISSDGSRALTANASGEVFLWNYATGDVLNRLHGHSDSARKVRFLPGSNRAISIGWDGRSFIWDLSSGAKQQLGTTKKSQFGSGLHIARLALSRDGKRAYIVDPNHSIECHDLEKAKMIWKDTVPRIGEHFMGLAVSPDERIAAITRGASLVWYDVQNQQVIQKYHDGNLKVFYPGPAAAFSPDGRVCAVGAQNEIILFRMPDRRPTRRLVGHTNRVDSICFSDDGSTIFSTGHDKTVRLFRI